MHGVIRWFFLSLFLVFATPAAFSQQTDPTFGTNGVVFTTFPNSADPLSRNLTYGRRGFALPNGGFAVFVDNYNLFSVKLPPFHGTGLVTYFENGGFEATGGFTNNRIAVEATQQPDGKIVTAGSTPGDWFVQRFNTDRTFDTTFNSTGSRVLGFGNNDDYARNVVVQPDGKILVSGYSNNPSGSVTVVARFNQDGTLDTAFGPYGTGILDIYDNGALSQKMVVRPNGKILLMYLRQDGQTTSVFYQLNSDGSPDQGFGDGGVLYAAELFPSTLADAKIQPDGKLLVLTTRQHVPENMVNINDQEIVLTRYNTDGSLDAAFGENGKSVVNTSPPVTGTSPFEPTGSEEARGLVIENSGKIAVVAHSAQVAPGLGAPSWNGYPGRLERKNVVYVLEFGPGGQLLGRNFSRRVRQDQVAAAYDPLEINGIFEQPGKGLIAYGSFVGYAYYTWPTFVINSRSVMLVRFSSISAVNNANNFYDYNFDGQADFPTYRSNPSGYANWILNRSQTKRGGTYQASSRNFGLPGDVPAPGDYDGDGIQDLAVFRPGEGEWFAQPVYLNNCGDPMDCSAQVHWGQNGDIAAPGDFDGDGKTDRAVFRPASGDWYIQFSSGGYTGLHFGQNGDLPVTGDYDGDGRSDVAVIRRENGNTHWFILQSSDNRFIGGPWGLETDKAVPGDYNGDGKTDLAVWRPSDGNWYVLANFSDFSAGHWGTNGDIPAPADYDGDGKTDFAVFRPSAGDHYALGSHDGAIFAYHSGSAGDIPVASAYVR